MTRRAVPEANPLNSHGRARMLLRAGYALETWCCAFGIYLLAAHAAPWKSITVTVCAVVNLGTIAVLRRL